MTRLVRRVSRYPPALRLHALRVDGYKPPVTELLNAQDDHIEEDAVYAVRAALVRRIRSAGLPVSLDGFNRTG